MSAATIQRTYVMLHPDRTRVLLRPFLLTNEPRARRICTQVMALPESEVHALWRQVQAELGERHANTREFLRRRFEQTRPGLRAEPWPFPPDAARTTALRPRRPTTRNRRRMLPRRRLNKQRRPSGRPTRNGLPRSPKPNSKPRQRKPPPRPTRPERLPRRQ
jgi:hypothetical protein